VKLFIYTLTFVLCTSLKTDKAPDLLLKKYRECHRDNSYSQKKMFDFFFYLDSLSVEMDMNINIKKSVYCFKTDETYTNTIRNLINSKNRFKRTLAYRLIGEIEDKNYNDTLTNRLLSEDTLASFWAFYSLTRLNPTSTNIAMEWLVRYEDLGDAHSIPSYLLMDTTSVINTGYKYILDDRPRAKIIALQSIALFDKSHKPDSIARIAINQWDTTMKGYAITAMGFCKRGNYKEIVKPFINTYNLNRTIKYLLEESPTKEDREFADTIKIEK
jgi:hypothetical protein